mmetsp:Transcript_28702/g.81112  ORF Transcript_28702/g.81112 Transcript_28702/m.81112 type:complete len:226 (+) Transcript_28702:83-760(+)
MRKDEAGDPGDERVWWVGVAAGLLMTPFDPITGVTTSIGCWYAYSRAHSTKLQQRLDAASAELQTEKRALEGKEQALMCREAQVRRFGVVLTVAAATGAAVFWLWWRRHQREQREEHERYKQALADLYEHWRRPPGARGGTPRHAGQEEDPPSDFVCVITGELFRDPVMCADGHTYERGAIEDWFSRGYSTSPLTNEGLEHTRLLPNHALRRAAEEFREPSGGTA